MLFVQTFSSPQQLAKLSLFHPGLVSLSVRAVSAQSDGLWIGRAGYREPPTLFYAEARLQFPTADYSSLGKIWKDLGQVVQVVSDGIFEVVLMFGPPCFVER